MYEAETTRCYRAGSRVCRRWHLEKPRPARLVPWTPYPPRQNRRIEPPVPGVGWQHAGIALVGGGSQGHLAHGETASLSCSVQLVLRPGVPPARSEEHPSFAKLWMIGGQIHMEKQMPQEYMPQSMTMPMVSTTVLKRCCR